MLSSMIAPIASAGYSIDSQHEDLEVEIETSQLANNLMALSVAAAFADEDDLPVIYENYKIIHEQLSEVYTNYGYIPYSIDGDNKPVDDRQNEDAMVQYILSNIMLTRSYETNPNISNNEKKIIVDSWKNIEDTELGNTFNEILLKQMILRGYVKEDYDTYKAYDYIDSNDFIRHMKTLYRYDTQEDEEYIKRQYLSGYYKAEHENDINFRNAESDYYDYKSNKNVIDTIDQMTASMGENESIDDIVGIPRLSIIYPSDTQYLPDMENMSSFNTSEYTQRITNIQSEYRKNSEFILEYYKITEDPDSENMDNEYDMSQYDTMNVDEDDDTSYTIDTYEQTKNETKYLSIPTNRLINLAYQNHDNNLIWDSMLYTTYRNPEEKSYASPEEWTDYFEYIELCIWKDTLEDEKHDIYTKIQDMKDGKPKQAMSPSETKEYDHLYDTYKSLNDQINDIENQIDENDHSENAYFQETEKNYYINGVAPFDRKYYEWYKSSIISDAIFKSAYNDQGYLTDSGYTKEPSSLTLTGDVSYDNVIEDESKKMNEFKLVYQNTTSRFATEISTYPDNVNGMTANQISKLYLAYADFMLDSINNDVLKNTIYLPSVQNARTKCLSLPYTRTYLKTDITGKPIIYTTKERTITTENIEDKILTISENNNLESESTLIANWKDRTSAEQLIKNRYTTLSCIYADLAITNLIQTRINNPNSIPPQTSELTKLEQNPLVTTDRKELIHTLINADKYEIAKSNNPELQPLRYIYVNQITQPIEPNMLELMATTTQWENDDKIRQVNKEKLSNVAYKYDTYQKIYQTLPEDTSEIYDLGFDVGTMIKILNEPSTTYDLCKKVTVNEVNVPPAYDQYCQMITHQHERKIKEQFATKVAVVLLILIIALSVGYSFWYTKKPRIKITKTMSFGMYEVQIENVGIVNGSFSKTVTFPDEITFPSTIPNGINIDVSGNKLQMEGYLKSGEKRILVLKPITKKE